MSDNNKEKSTAETIVDYSTLTVDSVSAGLAEVKIDDIAAVGKHAAAKVTRFDVAYTMFKADDKIAGAYEAACKVGTGAV